MKTLLPSALRTAALVTSLLLLPLASSAKETTPRDPATELLARHGFILVKAVGLYVEVGTFLIQVSVRLGQPTARLADGTWLYENYAPENSTAKGTLIVHFVHGRVSELALATPAVVAALRDPQRSATGTLIAGMERR